jgi:uncharacterized protein (TIGR03067 family)
MEEGMRPIALLSVLAGLLAVRTASAGEPHPSVSADRIAVLIARLGDEEFRTREAATAELQALGEAALQPLRQAVAATEDPEIRRRAATLVERLDYGQALRELTRLEGTWQGVTAWENGQQTVLEGESVFRTVIHRGDAVATDGRGVEVQRCTWQIVDAGATPCKADLVSSDGRIFRAIYEIDGDTLKYCGAYAEDESARPADFSTHDGDGRSMTTLKRAKAAR